MSGAVGALRRQDLTQVQRAGDVLVGEELRRQRLVGQELPTGSLAGYDVGLATGMGSSQDLATHIGLKSRELLRELHGGGTGQLAGEEELVLALQHGLRDVLGRDDDAAALVQQVDAHGFAEGLLLGGGLLEDVGWETLGEAREDHVLPRFAGHEGEVLLGFLLLEGGFVLDGQSGVVGSKRFGGDLVVSAGGPQQVWVGWGSASYG